VTQTNKNIHRIQTSKDEMESVDEEENVQHEKIGEEDDKEDEEEDVLDASEI
jgi:hypothetical protein